MGDGKIPVAEFGYSLGFLVAMFGTIVVTVGVVVSEQMVLLGSKVFLAGTLLIFSSALISLFSNRGWKMRVGNDG